MSQSRTPLIRTLVPVVLVALLAGACASTSPPMRFYLLSPAEEPAAPAGGLGDALVVVGPLQMPGYLDRPQIVVRQPDGRFSLREYDRWGEPLDALFTRTLAANLVRLTGSPRIVAFPPPARAAADRRILGRVVRFDADAGGLATLEVQWSILGADGEALVPVRIDAFRVQAAGGDAAAEVVALSEALAQFSRQVAEALLATGPG